MPLRVVRLMDRLNVGGPARQAIELSARLGAPSWRTVLAYGTVEPHEESLENAAKERGLSLEYIPALARPLNPLADLRAFFAILGLLRRERPQVVHTHKSKAGALGRVAAAWAGTPVVIHTYHGHVLHGYFNPIANRIFRFIESLLARLTDRIVVLTKTQRDELLGLGIGRPEQYAVIPSGVDLEPFLRSESLRGKLRGELGIADAVPVVGIVGRLVPIKRHEDFLMAAKLIVGELPDCRFLIVGDGERKAELEDLSYRLRLQGRVHFLGSRADMPKINADLTVGVLCSTNEGLPMALIEAMAAGKPVVATKVGGVPDLVVNGETGLLVEPERPEKLARAILEVIQDPARAKKMGARGREAARAYGADALARNTGDLYRAVLAPGEKT